METREIPREEWKDFLDRFSRVHENWLVNVEVVGRELGDQEESHDVPLEGVSFEPKGSEAGRIDIMVGGAPDHHANHAVEAPRRLHLLRDDQGADQALEIEDEDGTTTLLTFRVPARPETLDGVVGV
jgi:uncharacterized protein DUF5335